jgi:hypothetical protein
MEPNIGMELLRIHAILTRGLKISAENAQVFRDQGFPNTMTREGYLNYVNSFVAVINAHHLTEDDLAFPYLRDKFPEAPYELLKTQHQNVVLVLNQVRAVIEPLTTETETGGLLDLLNESLKEIAVLWYPHIQIEEGHFSVEKMKTRIPLEDHIKMGKLFMEHSQQHATPDYLVVPFLVYNLEPEERVTFIRELPPVVTQQLIPTVWKEKWKPMAPFLLP